MKKLGKLHYKVRFHLANGKNHKKWQIAKFGEETRYLDPSRYQLVLHDCKLNNVPSVANKIFLGSHKTVCAWISCKDISVVPKELSVTAAGLSNIVYNPKNNPYWSLFGKNIDNNEYNCLITKDNKVYIKHE